MSLSRKRYGLPLLFFLAGVWISIELIREATRRAQIVDLFTPMQGNATSDITFLVIIAIPILLLVYFLFAIPGSAVILSFTKAIKSRSYDMDVMNVGRQFGGSQMVRRAVSPALFSLATSEILRGFITEFLFGGTTPNFTVSLVILEIPSNVILTLMRTLIILPVALLIFTPTWVLEDSGIVTHLKPDKMLIRQSPDTTGVGRWFAGIMSNYAFVAYPIAMFTTRFYEPFLDGTLTINNLLSTFLWVIFLPFLVMAFVVPVILLNEATLRRTRQRVVGIAKRFGAVVVRKERIEAVRRRGPSTPQLGYDDMDDENVDALPRPVYDAETGIMTTAKRIKKSKTSTVTTSKKTAKKSASKKKRTKKKSSKK
jgi:hypothetical protein